MGQWALRGIQICIHFGPGSGWHDIGLPVVAPVHHARQVLADPGTLILAKSPVSGWSARLSHAILGYLRVLNLDSSPYLICIHL